MRVRVDWKSRKTVSTLVLISFLCGMLFAHYAFSASSFTAPDVYLEGLPSAVDYRIETDGTYTWAVKDNGDIVYSGTDAATVMRSVFNSLTNGGTVFIAAGNYSIGSWIPIENDNIVIQGAGKGNTWLVRDTTQPLFHMLAVVSTNSSSRSNIVIRGISFDQKVYSPTGNKVIIGLGLNSTDGGQTVAWSPPLGYGENFVVENCEFYNSDGPAINSYRNRNVKIQYCDFYDCRNDVSMMGDNDVLIQGNHFNNTDGNSVYITGYTNTATPPYDFAYDVKVIGNYWYAVGDTALATDRPNQNGTYRMVVDGNTFQAGWNDGNWVTGGCIISDSIQVVLTNNHFYGGASLVIYDGPPSYVDAPVVVDGITIRGHWKNTDTSVPAIRVWGNLIISNFDICGNGTVSGDLGVAFEIAGFWVIASNGFIANMTVGFHTQLGNSTYSKFSNIRFYNVNTPFQDGATSSRIFFHGSLNNIWIISDNGNMDYGINLGQSGSILHCVNVRVQGYNIAPVNNPARAINEGGCSWVVENGGIASVANGGWISHGLVTTPTTITVTSLNSTYDGVPVLANVASYNATMFQVGLYWTNGTAITTALNVGWYAEYKP